MIAYTMDLHTGTNTWSYETSGFITSKVWITCNGERVDMQTQGYPKPYLLTNTGVMTVLEIMEAREDRAR